MSRFCVYGVVKNGQVVLDVPLPLADGTEVVVTDTVPDDVDSIGPDGPPPPEVAKRMILGLVKRLDLLDDPNWKAKLGVRE
jgi:hypothetical protein